MSYKQLTLALLGASSSTVRLIKHCDKLYRAFLSAKQLAKAPVSQAVTTFDKLLRASVSNVVSQPGSDNV